MSATSKATSALILLYILLSFCNYSIIDEDAFIYFRCVDNAISGHGYAFNPGTRIEAGSSITWFGLLCLLGAAGLNLLSASKLLGIICGCCSIVVTVAIARRFSRRLFWLLVPAVLTILTPSFIFRNQMGLETPLYCLAFQLTALFCLDGRLVRYWLLPALLLAFTRPEGLFLLLGIVPALYMHKVDRAAVAGPLVTMVLAVTAIFAARFFYFHDFLPSPFYIKVYTGKHIMGLKYLFNFVLMSHLYLFIVPAGLAALLQRWNMKKILLLNFIVVFYAWIVLAGADDKPFYRHCLPALPLVFVFCTTGIETVFDKTTRWQKTAVMALIVLFACVSLLFSTSRELFTFPFKVIVPNPVTRNIQQFFNSPRAYAGLIANRIRQPARYNYINHSKEILIGEFIRQNYAPGSTIVYDQMGQAPYTAGMDYVFIDSWGLLDKNIGRFYFRQGSQKSTFLGLYDRFSRRVIARVFPETPFWDQRQQAVDYIFDHDPAVIMITAILLSFPEKVPNGILTDERLAKRYTLKYSIEDWVIVFEKKGLDTRPFSAPPELKVLSGDAAFVPWERYPQITGFNN